MLYIQHTSAQVNPFFVFFADAAWASRRSDVTNCIESCCDISRGRLALTLYKVSKTTPKRGSAAYRLVDAGANAIRALDLDTNFAEIMLGCATEKPCQESGPVGEVQPDIAVPVHDL